MEKAQPYLSRISSAIYDLGSNTQACTFKLVMNLQIASQVQALAEGITLARKSGIPDHLFFSVFQNLTPYSKVHALKAEKVSNHDYINQFSVKHMAKDLRLPQEERGENQHFPLLTACRRSLKEAIEEGWSNDDFSKVVELYK